MLYEGGGPRFMVPPRTSSRKREWLPLSSAQARHSGAWNGQRSAFEVVIASKLGLKAKSKSPPQPPINHWPSGRAG
jgi:hypothetical protein